MTYKSITWLKEKSEEVTRESNGAPSDKEKEKRKRCNLWNVNDENWIILHYMTNESKISKTSLTNSNHLIASNSSHQSHTTNWFQQTLTSSYILTAKLSQDVYIYKI